MWYGKSPNDEKVLSSELIDIFLLHLRQGETLQPIRPPEAVPEQLRRFPIEYLQSLSRASVSVQVQVSVLGLTLACVCAHGG